MAEKAKEQPKDINLDMEHLTVKGKIHAEQYNNLRAQKIQSYSNWGVTWRPKTKKRNWKER